MKALFTFFMILASISIIFYLGGVSDSNTFSMTQLIINLLNGNDISSTTLWVFAIGIAAALITAVGVNTFTGGSSSAGITIVKSATFIGFIPAYVGDFLSILKRVRVEEAIATGLDTFVYYVIFVIGGFLLIGYIYSLVDFLFEND